MQKIEDNKNTINFDDAIDLKELFLVLVQGKWIITLMTVFFSIFGIIYSLSLPNIYESKALLAPVDASSSLMSGALSEYRGLAGLAGISLSSQDNSSNSKKAVEVMGSLSFFENYIMPNIFLPDLMAVESWNEKENKIIYDENIFKNDSNTWVRDSYPKKLIPSAQESFEVFKGNHFYMREDNKTGYIVLSVKHLSPLLAKQWVETIVREVNTFYRQKDKAQSEKAVIFLNKQMAANSLSEIRQVTASLLQKEIQKLTLVEANNDYVFEYIYPPSLMEKKSDPKRSLIVILFFLFGSILGTFLVLIRFYVSNQKTL